MKKPLVLVILLVFFFTPGVFAQETKESSMSAGLGLEWNWDSRHDFAGGIPVNIIYDIHRDFSLGLNVTGSYNFFSMEALELSILARSYIDKNRRLGTFIQGEMGAFIIFEEEGITPMPLLGFHLGYRHLLTRLFYLEPYGRLGYPFGFGIGLTAGILF
ncbi:MAG: hypothetical protein FWH19_01190 [Treponema sp.]|nr:hypothetical protein [Treponema sp.]